MTGIVERLRNISRGDHERGCQGREYVCSCDYDETSWKTAEEAADEIYRLRRELEEARRALIDTRALVGEAAMTGFNCHEGDWAERLYANNGNITAVLRAGGEGL